MHFITRQIASDSIVCSDTYHFLTMPRMQRQRASLLMK